MGALDRKTRGRTSRFRLRALDAWLCRCEKGLLEARDAAWEGAVFVDVGFGEHPWTTLESARAFRTLNPELKVIGVERDPARVAAAAAHSDALTGFREGGFALPLAPDEPARLIRAMNVLRQYGADVVPEAHRTLGRSLLPSGLLVEGSSDTSGSVLVAHLLRKGPERLSREALLFHTDFGRGFGPLLFRDWLPRDLRRRVVPGEPIHAFFEAWLSAWREVRAEERTGPREAFRASIVRLSSRWEGVSTEGWLLDRGYLLWRPPGGIPD